MYDIPTMCPNLFVRPMCLLSTINSSNTLSSITDQIFNLGSKVHHKSGKIQSRCNVSAMRKFYRFLPRDATQSAVMRLHVVSPSIRPSVTFRYRDHTLWNTSKIISPPNSLRLMRLLTPTLAILCNGNTPKIRGNKGGVRQEHIKVAKSPKRCKKGPWLVTIMD